MGEGEINWYGWYKLKILFCCWKITNFNGRLIDKSLEVLTEIPAISTQTVYSVLMMTFHGVPKTKKIERTNDGCFINEVLITLTPFEYQIMIITILF